MCDDSARHFVLRENIILKTTTIIDYGVLYENKKNLVLTTVV